MKTNEHCRLAHFGAFDIESLGDSLFAPVLASEMRKRLAAVEITLFSLREVVEPYNRNTHVYSFNQFEEIHLQKSFDAVVIGGGEMLNFHAISFKDMDGVPFTYAPGEVWAMPVRLARKYGLPVILNCVGASRSFTASQASFVRNYISQASYVSVRDRYSKLRLDAAFSGTSGAREVCDSLWLLNRHYPASLLQETRAAVAADCSLDLSEPYIVIQYGTTYRYREVAEAARLICQKYGTRLLMVPVNYCHEDLLGLELIKKELNDECAVVREKLQPLEIMSVIAGACAFLGTSLHGSLIALSYDVKTLPLDMYPAFVSKIEGLFEQTGLSEYVVPDPSGIVPAFDRLMEDADYWDRVHSRIRLLQERLDGHFDQMAEVIKENKMNIPDIMLCPYSDDGDMNADREEIAVKSYLTIEKEGQPADMLLSVAELQEGRYQFHFQKLSLAAGSSVSWTLGLETPAGIRLGKVLFDGRDVDLLPANAVKNLDGTNIFSIPSAKYFVKVADVAMPTAGELMITCEIVQLPLATQNAVLSSEISNQSAWIDSLITSERGLKDRERMLEKKLQDQNDLIQKLQMELFDNEDHIEELLESERQKINELSRVYSSRGWRLLTRFYRMEECIIPMHSKRRLFARLFFKSLRHPLRYIKKLNPRSLKNFYKLLKANGVEGINEKIVNMEVLYDGIPAKPLELVDMTKTTFSKMIFPSCEKPAVSIVIPVYNKFNYTYGCLESILTHTTGIEYEIIIADDCSTDQTKNIADIVKNIVVSKTAGNQGFLRNCNQAATMAKGQFVLFLNNDTNVQKGWLTSLVTLMESNQSIGMTGSKLVYPDGRLQEAGGIIWSDGSAWNYGKFANPEAPEYNYVKDVDYISGASIMIRKSLWQEIGGFDETFAPAYCEDSDLAFEVRKRGYRVVYQPQSVVVHFEGISHGTDTSAGIKTYQVTNSQKFKKKWNNALKLHAFPNKKNVFAARDRSRNKKTILMIDHYVPTFDKDAGSRTVFQYLKLFVSQGFNVKFIGDNFFRNEPYTTVLQQMGIEVLYGPYYAKEWQHWIKNNARIFDFVFLNRPHISKKYIDYIKENTSAKILYYGHDLHFLREMREYELHGNPESLAASKDWKKVEFDIMRKAACVYYPSQIEVAEIAKVDPSIPAKAIPAYMFEEIIKADYDFEKRKDVMFIGGFAHKPNVDAILWFAQEIYPIVHQLDPEMKIYILGSNPPPEIKALQSEYFVIKGFVSDDELTEFYHSTRMSIVPLRYGAGIKGKVIESLFNGCPVMTTSVGAEGISGANDIMAIEDDAEKFARHLIELYRDRAELVRMSESCAEYIRQNYTPQRAWEVVGPDFK